LLLRRQFAFGVDCVAIVTVHVVGDWIFIRLMTTRLWAAAIRGLISLTHDVVQVRF